MQPGFAAGFANQQPQAERMYQDIIAGRQRLPPDAAAIPQQGPPGMASMQPQAAPAPAPQMPPAGGGGAPPMTAGVGPLPSAPGPVAGVTPQASPPPAAPPAGGFQAPSGPAAGGAQFDPTQRLRAMAMQLKRANPGLDNQTLAIALDQQINAMKGLAPEDRIVMQMELAQQKFQTTRDIAGLRDDLERLKETGRNTRADAANQTRENVAGQTNETRRDIAGQAETGRNTRAASAETGRNTRAAARIDASNASAQVKSQYKTLAAQRAAIKDQISAFNAGTPGGPDKATVTKLQGDLKKLDAQITDFWSRNQSLPRPSELDRLPADAAPAAGGAPGAPKPGEVQDGYRFKGGDPAAETSWEKVQ